MTLAACGPQPKIAPTQAEAAALVSATVADEQTRTAMSGEGSVTLSQNGVPLKGELSVAARADGRVRLDLTADSGQTMFVLASNGTTVTWLDFKQRHAEQHSSEEATLTGAGLSGLSAKAVALLLLGRLPCSGERHSLGLGKVAIEPCLGGKLEATYSKKRDSTGSLLTRVVLTGAAPAEARLFAHTTAGFPRRIELDTAAGHAVVSLREVDAGAKLPDSTFELPVPPGFN